MNYWKITFFAAIIAMLACQNAEIRNPKSEIQNTEGVQSVNAPAAQNFARQFPKAEEVVWDTLETGLSASFFDGTTDRKAYFDAKGAFQFVTNFIETTATLEFLYFSFKIRCAEAGNAVISMKLVTN